MFENLFFCSNVVVTAVASIRLEDIKILDFIQILS